jgi:mannose/fructose/N-acetylgalactosamine-specific phosphotransferase system component IIC
MNKENFNKEMKTADAQSEARETNGLNWTYISLGLIILTFIAVIIAMTVLPRNTLQKLNQNSNMSNSSAPQK